MRNRWLTLMAILVFILGLIAAGGGEWLAKVPAREHEKTNPFRDQPQAMQAGQLLFAEHCAQCHGQNAEGKKNRPSLRTNRVQSDTTEGDLHWFLVNGNPRRGMPSWSKLPDPQLWQLVSYLKSLKEKD